MNGTCSFLDRPFNSQSFIGNIRRNMALKVGQLEKLTNSELQKEFMKDKARGKEHLWQSPTNRRHQENLRDLHERARGKHGNIR